MQRSSSRLSKTQIQSKQRSSTKRKSLYELSGDGSVYSYITGRPRAGPRLGEQQFAVRQTVLSTSWLVSSVAVPVFSSIQFTIADVDQFSSFLAVFDQYKFNSIEVYIEPQGSNLNITNTGHLTTVLDFDDANALTTYGQALDYSNAITTGGQSCQYRRFVPHIAVSAYNGAFTGFKNEPADWLDAASTSIQHYGLKAAANVTSSAMTYDLTLVYHLSFRCVR